MILNEPSRSRCRSDSSFTKVTHGNQPFHLRNLQQGFPERSEPSASSARAQPAVEAAAEDEPGGEEEGVRVPGEELRAP